LVHPRPVAGAVRPVVHPPTVKYNAKKTKGGWKADAAKEEARKITAEEAKANTSRTLKAAWNDARLVGFRAKRAAERAEKAAQEALKKSK